MISAGADSPETYLLISPENDTRVGTGYPFCKLPVEIARPLDSAPFPGSTTFGTSDNGYPGLEYPHLGSVSWSNRPALHTAAETFGCTRRLDYPSPFLYIR